MNTFLPAGYIMGKMSFVNDKVSFLNKVFGTCVIGNDGLNVAVCCPNRNCGSYGSSAKKKLVIRADTDNYHCWVCDIKGRNLNSLLRKHSPQHIHEYREKFLAKSGGISIELPEEQEIVVNVPQGFKLLATSLKCRDPDIRDTIRYLRNRGLTNRDLWYFKMGTCTQGRYRRRVILPSFDADGDLNYFVARTIDSGAGMKYLNAKVPKKNVIFNEININWKQELTLVEGPFDLVKCDDNATCLLGSHFSEDYALFHEIIKHSTPVILALDPDARGKTQAYAKKLSSYGISVRILSHGAFNDVGEMSKLDFIEAKQRAKRWESDDRLYHLISTIKSGSLL
jgi:hypothetical protein